MRTALISLIISVVCIAAYHLWITRHTRNCISGIYTVNIAESIATLKQQAVKDALEGKGQSPDNALMRIQQAIDRLSATLPDGYVIMPDACVIAGKRKRIDLLRGTVTETKKAVRLR